MCRWFAYISPTEPTLLADVLLTPDNAITKQCSDHYLPYLLPYGEERDLDDASDDLLKMRNSLLNVDGLGVAWYTPASSAYSPSSMSGLRPALYKSASPASNDFNFRSLCANTESTCLLAHIRATSGSVVSQPNSHPFVFGRHAFMHNGVISDFSRVRRDLLDLLAYDAYDNIKGSTDSEHAAALYMTYLTSSSADAKSNGSGATKDAWELEYPLDAMRDAMRRAVVAILELQKKTLPDGGSVKRSPNSLNFCATDGRRLVACRFRNHATEQPPSLYWSEFAGRTLNRKYPGDPNAVGGGSVAAVEEQRRQEQQQQQGGGERVGRHTIVASEPTTFDEKEWHLIGRNAILMVDEFGVETEVPLEYDEAKLNAGKA